MKKYLWKNKKEQDDFYIDFCDFCEKNYYTYYSNPDDREICIYIEKDGFVGFFDTAGKVQYDSEKLITSFDVYLERQYILDYININDYELYWVDEYNSFAKTNFEDFSDIEESENFEDFCEFCEEDCENEDLNSYLREIVDDAIDKINDLIDYAPDTAIEVWKNSNDLPSNDFDYFCEQIVKSPQGYYYFVGKGGANTKYAETTVDGNYTSGEEIRLITEKEAMEFVMN